MKKSLMIGCAIAALSLTACKESANSSTLACRPQEVQRFVLVNIDTFGGGLALDTKTGQLCRTWDLQENFGVIKATPLCKDLYNAEIHK